MTKILNYIWRGWFVLLGILLTLILGIPVFLLSLKKEHYKYCYQFIRVWCFGMFYGMGFRYELISLSKDKIDPQQQYVFIANHTSIIDILLPCILIRDHPLCYVGKKELVKIPVFGMIYKRICVMVDRSSAKSRADVYRRCAERMQEGQSVVIFPEGGVPDDTSVILDHFKDGAFILASKHHFPLAVYTFVGLKQMFPFNHAKGYPGKVKIYFNGIMEPQTGAKDLKASAHSEIKKVLENSIGGNK
ncbi:MAG: 1-acyl-sn-glycerol-3-phosphate acyltransferase [Kaistella sp.]|nr:1-acyl-sn-glycerol-3-phosphate acyltransferase [Kaistella sp.]